MKKQLLMAAGLGFLALGGLLAFLLFAGRTTIDREHFGAVREGMTRAEMLRVLGPPRNECLDPVVVWVSRHGKRQSAEIRPGPITVRFFPDEAGEELVWVSRSGLLATRVDADGRLRETYVSDVVGPDQSLLGDALRRLIGREASRSPSAPPAK